MRGKIKKSQISIAEMVMQRHMPDGSTNIIRVGIEMPVEIPMKVSANVELPATEWSCTAYCDDQGKMSRIRMTHVDSFSALSAAYNAALLFIKGFSVIYGKEISYLDQSNLFISTSTFAMENSEVNTVVEKTDSDTRTPPSSPST